MHPWFSMGYPVSFPPSSLSELFVFHLCFANALYEAEVLIRTGAHRGSSVRTSSGMVDLVWMAVALRAAP
jgi:hypothetical protein